MVLNATVFKEKKPSSLLLILTNHNMLHENIYAPDEAAIDYQNGNSRYGEDRAPRVSALLLFMVEVIWA
jgi:hypothetical protein